MLTIVGGEEFHHWYRQARRLVEGESDLRSRAALLRTWGYFSHYRGEHREAIRAMREARPVAVEAGDRYVEADTFLIEAMAASLVGSPSDAGRLADGVVRLGRSIGSPRIAGLGLAAGARADLRQGNPSRAGRQLSAARRTLLTGGSHNEMLEVDFVDAGIHLDRGAWRRVAGPAGRGAAAARDSGWVLYESMGPLLVGRGLLGAGRPEEAAAELERALASATAAGAAGTAALAGAALEQAQVLAGHPRTDPPTASPPSEVEAEAIRSETGGLAALTAGEAEEAAAAFTRAVDHWRRLGLTVWLARALSLQSAAARRMAPPAHRRPPPHPGRRRPRPPQDPGPRPPHRARPPRQAERRSLGRRRLVAGGRRAWLDCPAEAWPSGRRHTPGKRVGGQLPRGFEPLSLRHEIRSPTCGPPSPADRGPRQAGALLRGSQRHGRPHCRRGISGRNDTCHAPARRFIRLG
jgi:hypothetical protein